MSAQLPVSDALSGIKLTDRCRNEVQHWWQCFPSSSIATPGCSCNQHCMAAAYRKPHRVPAGQQLAYWLAHSSLPVLPCSAGTACRIANAIRLQPKASLVLHAGSDLAKTMVQACSAPSVSLQAKAGGLLTRWWPLDSGMGCGPVASLMSLCRQ